MLCICLIAIIHYVDDKKFPQPVNRVTLWNTFMAFFSHGDKTLLVLLNLMYLNHIFDHVRAYPTDPFEFFEFQIPSHNVVKQQKKANRLILRLKYFFYDIKNVRSVMFVTRKLFNIQSGIRTLSSSR